MDRGASNEANIQVGEVVEILVNAFSCGNYGPEDGPKKIRKHRRQSEKSGNDGHPDLSELTGAFRKQKGKIHRCFENHQTSVSAEQSQNVSVLFSVVPSGKVAQVQLSPQSLSGTPLGNCLLDVSKSTSFPPQSDAISFRIPLSAKRVKP